MRRKDLDLIRLPFVVAPLPMPLLKPRRVCLSTSKKDYIPPQGQTRTYGIYPPQGIKGVVVVPPVPPAPPAGPETVKIYPEADAFVQSYYPDNNYGSSTACYVGTSQAPNILRTYMRFNLASISSGRDITLAKLYLNVYNVYFHSGTRWYDLCFVSNDTWGEGTITWNNKPTLGAVLINDALIDTTGWKNYDITSQVETEYNGDKKISLCWKHYTEDTGYWLYWNAYMKEYATEADRPYLEVTHAPL